MKDCEVVTKYIIRNKKFYIVRFTNDDGNKLYGAIDFDYVENGKLTRQLNGVQMHVSTDLNQCIEYTRTSVEFDYWVAQGYTNAQAFEKVFDTKLTDRANDILNNESKVI